MLFFLISFFAGILTVLTPCVLPILPLVLGATATGLEDKRRPILIVASLAVSVFIFTILLKVSSVFINVPIEFWQYLSAFIILIFGISLLFPGSIHIPGYARANQVLGSSYQKRNSVWGAILIGAALGPVFTTCSPTFFLILATVLPSSFTLGIIYLLAYIFGLSVFLLLIAFLGQRLLIKVLKFSDPEGKFMKSLGVMFLILAIIIALGFDKKIENYLLNGRVDFTKLETKIRDSLVTQGDALGKSCSDGSCRPSAAPKVTAKIFTTKYHEIEKPSGFVNSEPFKLKDLIGKKVILLDFMTYSCINCQRTYPYLKDWYKKYKDKGLEIVAIQTPEFSFEKKIENVENSAKENGLTFPIVLDNDYATWNAYANQYWPHKYLIDLNGNIVYDHIGEGSYKETEAEIVKALGVSKINSNVSPTSIFSASPETYFGAFRNTNFGNGIPNMEQSSDFVIPNTLLSNKFYLGGKWDISSEFALNRESSSVLEYKFNAKEVYLVAESDTEATAEVYVDGVKTSTIKIKDSKLYHLVSLDTPGEHLLKIIFKSSGIKIYTFTFG